MVWLKCFKSCPYGRRKSDKNVFLAKIVHNRNPCPKRLRTGYICGETGLSFSVIDDLRLHTYACSYSFVARLRDDSIRSAYPKYLIRLHDVILEIVRTINNTLE